ncbi:hypothetical protein ACHAXR_013579, partial [Thalassiosira sp. AJA248-18]
MLHHKHSGKRGSNNKTGVADYFAVLGIDSFIPPDDADENENEKVGGRSGDDNDDGGAAFHDDDNAQTDTNPNNSTPSSPPLPPNSSPLDQEEEEDDVGELLCINDNDDGTTNNDDDNERSNSMQTVHAYSNLSNSKTPRNSNLTKKRLQQQERPPLKLDYSVNNNDNNNGTDDDNNNLTTRSTKQKKSEEEILHEERFQREIVQLALVSTSLSLEEELEWTVLNNVALPLHDNNNSTPNNNVNQNYYNNTARRRRSVHLAYRRRGQNVPMEDDDNDNNDENDCNNDNAEGLLTSNNHPQHYHHHNYYTPGVADVSLHHVKLRPSTIPNYYNNASFDAAQQTTQSYKDDTPKLSSLSDDQNHQNQNQTIQNSPPPLSTPSTTTSAAAKAAKHFSSFARRTATGLTASIAGKNTNVVSSVGMKEMAANFIAANVVTKSSRSGSGTPVVEAVGGVVGSMMMGGGGSTNTAAREEGGGNTAAAGSNGAEEQYAQQQQHQQQQPHHLYDTGKEGGSFETDIDGATKHFQDAHGEVKLWQSPTNDIIEEEEGTTTTMGSSTRRRRREHFFPDTPMPQCAAADDNNANNNVHNNNDGIVRKALQDMLPLPNGCTEWIIPDFCHVLHLPTSELVQQRRKKIIEQQQRSIGSMQHRQPILVDRTHAVSISSGAGGIASPSSSSTRGGGMRSPSSIGMEAMYLSPTPTPRESGSTVNNDALGGGEGGGRALMEGGPMAAAAYSPVVLLSNSQLAPDPAYIPTLVSSSSSSTSSGHGGNDTANNKLEEEDAHIYIPLLAIRRQRIGDEERYHEDPAVVDIQLTSFLDDNGNPVPPMVKEEEEEEEEEEFGRGSKTLMQFGAHPDILKKTPWTPSSDYNNNNHNNKSTGLQEGQQQQQPLIIILLRHNIPLGITDLPFPTRVLDRFPQKNYRGMPFPEEELPMFCYAGGSMLVRDKVRNLGMPKSFGFVVKNERGDSIYVSCLTFQEPLTKRRKHELDQLSTRRRHTSLPHRAHHRRIMQKRRRSNLRTNLFNNNHLVGFDDIITYENKTICLVGRYPYWTEFRRFLTHLHLVSGSSSSDIPLERNISHLLLSVPLPKPGGQCVLVPFSTMNEPMALVMPPLKDLPLVDLSYDRLFAALDVPTVVTIVLGFLCLERKVILISTRQALLLDCCELLKTLLFPFELCCPYAPHLTQPFMSCLEFPGATFVGIHDSGQANGLAKFVRDSIPEDSIIVELDTGEINCDGNRYETLKAAYQIIPAESRSLLIKEIETLCQDAGIVPGQEPLDYGIDSAIDSTAVPSNMAENFGKLKQQHHEPLDDRAVRDNFLRFFCSILGGYERFLVVPDADFLTSGNDWFDSSKFIAAATSNRTPFLGALVDTQLFQSFIQRRTEASDVHCMLFDECLTEYHSSAVPYGRLSGGEEGDGPHITSYNLLVDECATEPDLLLDDDESSFLARSDVYNKSFGNDNDTATQSSSGYAESTISDTPSLDKDTPYAINASGDIVTIPSTAQLPPNTRYLYCVDGNPSFPTTFDRRNFLPKEPDFLATSSEVPPPILTRSEREREEAIRLCNMTVSRRGPQKQHRCLWQLAKFMGSQFLGAWLMCIPNQISQTNLPINKKSKILLRALGALRTLRSHRRIVADEAAYRALIVACGRCGTDRRIELMKLYGLMRSDGIFPNAVTLGQYTRAIAEGYSNVNVDGGTKVGMQLVLPSDGPIKRECFDLEVLANNSILEESGLKWRSRGKDNPVVTVQPASRVDGAGSKDDQNQPPTISPSKTFDTVTTQRSVKTKRSWQPVSCSSSFRPESNVEDGPETDNIRLFALWSRATTCKACSYAPLDEEIQGGWDVIHNKLETESTVVCPRCSGMILPLIGYEEMTVAELLEPENSNGASAPRGSDLDVSGVTQDADLIDVPPQLEPSIMNRRASLSTKEQGQSGFVTYFSPQKLRMMLEELLLEYGEEALDRDRLRMINPEVLFNLWWYSARFSLPLPLAITSLLNEGNADDTSDSGKDDVPSATEAFDCCAFASWDKTVALHGCRSAAKAISAAQTLSSTSTSDRFLREKLFDNPNTDIPLLSFFNLQSYAQGDWDHPDFSEILVALVKACETRDLLPVVECVFQRNQARQEMAQGASNSINDASFESAGTMNFSFGASTEASFSPSSIELDCYRTILYLARYQCTTAFHAFFPTTIRACKGYHFWCAQGTSPLPIFDRAFREAAESYGKEKKMLVPIPV